MKFMKKNLWAIVFIVMLTIVPIFAFADNHTGGNTPPPPTPTGGNDPAKIKNPLGETKTVEEVMEKLLVGVIKIGIPRRANKSQRSLAVFIDRSSSSFRCLGDNQSGV